MTLLHGITVLDLIDELPPGSRGFVPADIAGFFELLAIVDHATLTSGAHYIHHGVLQSAQDAGLSLPRGFPLELPGLNTGVRFQFSSTRAQPSGGQNLEPEPSGWQLDLFLDRLAVPIPGLKPAVLIEAAPSQPAHLAAAGGSDVVKLYGKGVLRISSGASGVDVRLIADPDPFTPDAPIGAVLKLGLSPPHALFGDGSTGFGMTLGEVTVDASEEFTPTEIIARGHGPEWQGFGINEAAIYLPRNLPGVGDVSLGVKDLLIGTSDPGGVQLEAWLQLGQSATAAGNLQFLQDVRGHVHDMGGPAGADNQRSLTVHGETGETARVRVRVNAPATNAQWKRPGEEVWSTGVDTGWFAVRVGGGDGNVLHYRDVTTVGEGSDARQVAGEELLFEFIRGAPTPPVHPPQIRVERGALGWDNVAHLGGSAAELGAPTFRAMATVPALTDAQKAALTWELTQAGATVTGHGESFTPSVTWQVGEHDLVLRDGDNRRRRLKIQVLERGLLIVGARAGVFEVEGGVSSAATPTSVVARHTLRRFHAEGLLDSRGASASIAGATVTVSDGALADLTLERGGGGEPDTPTPPATPPVAHVRVLMDYDTTNALGWHEIHAQQTGDGTLDPWGPAPFYSAHANLEHTGDARRSDIAGLSAWVASIQAIDPNIKFVVIGHCCDLGSQSYNERLGQDRAKAGRQLLINSGAAEAQVLARGELRTDVMPSGPLPADPSGFAGGGDSSRTLTERTAVRWRIKHHISDSTRSGWGNSRTVPERERSRGVDIYALVPAANAGDGEPSVDDAQSSTRRRSLVPGGDSAITPAVSPAESNLNYRFELRAKWDSPTWVDERDSIPVLVQLTFDWTPTDLPLPDTGGGDSQAIRPVNPQTGGTPDNYRIVARFTFDPRSGQAIFSASLDSPGDENGLAKFTSSTDDAAGIAGKTFAAALALGPALLADVSTASPESAGVRIGALLAAVVAATALDIVQEGSVVLHRVEIEHLQRDLGSLAGSRTRLLCDYVVELKCSAAMFGVVSEDPIKLRYKNVGLELDDSKQGIEKFNLVFEEADFEVANPGKWRINGWLGQLLGITAIRLGTGSVWFELDMELALDLGVVEISRATIRITIKDGGVTVDLRGLAASVDIPGTVKGAGALQVGGDGDVSASLDLTIIPADIRAYAAFVMRDGMTHLEAGLRFATAIPLGGTGFGIYGFMGRFVSNGTRNLAGLSSTDPVQREMQWYALPPVGPTSKYIKRDGQYAIGLGVVVGTMPDAGFTFNAEGMLTFEFPDPSVVLTIDASLMNPPSGAASEQGSGGAGYSLQLLGVISVSAAGLAIGIAGKFTVPEVVEATIPFAAWFPFQSGGPAGYLRVGSDGHMGRAGEPVSVKILPKIFDLKAWAFFMVEEKELLQLGKHPDFNFHGFSIGFGTGFSLKWGGDVVYLEVSASILAGFGTRPFTLMAGIFLKGELWLVIIGLSVSAELILRIAEDSWDLRGKVCGKISFFFFTIEGCVDFQIGEEPSPPPPPLEPLITGVQLADKRARVLADAVDEATTTTLTDANTAWPDATIVIHFAHTVQVALEAGSVKSTQTAVAGGWSGTDRVKYLYRLTKVELLDVAGNPVTLTDSAGAPIAAPDWPSVWWLPAHRAGLPEEGEPPAGEHEGWDLGVLKWDPAPWARAVPRGGDGLASDPSEVIPRACDDPPAPTVHCVFGDMGERTGVDAVILRGPISGAPPYRSYFTVHGTEGYGPYSLEMMAELALLYGMTLVPGAHVDMPATYDPAHEHSVDGAWRLPYLVKQGAILLSLGFTGDYVGDVMAPDLVLAVCFDYPGGQVERETCVTFGQVKPGQQLGDSVTVDKVVFRDLGRALQSVDKLPLGAPDGTSELAFSTKGLEIKLPVAASEVSVEAAWFDDREKELGVFAYDESGAQIGESRGGAVATVRTYTITAPGITRLVVWGGNGSGIVSKVCYKAPVEIDREAWAKQVLAYMLGGQHAEYSMTHLAAVNQQAPVLPIVRGIYPDGEKEPWVGVPINVSVGEGEACLYLRYTPRENPGPWAGFEILPFPRMKLKIVSSCAVSLDAYTAAQEDDDVREELQDAVNDAVGGDQDDRVVLLDAGATYRVRVRYDAAIWQKSDDSPNPPNAATLNWSSLPASIIGHMGQVSTYRFKTAPDGAIADGALLAFQEQAKFDPRALLRYLRGFDPDVAGPHHLLDDLLWVHFDVEWVEALLARYGYSLDLTVRRTDPPPQPEGAPAYPLIAPYISEWIPLPIYLQDLADQLLGEALEEAPCMDGPIPEGGSAALRAELDPRAEYDIVVTAKHPDDAKTEHVKRGHFKTSRYRDVSELVEAMGFPITRRDGANTGAESNPLYPFDFLASAPPPTSVALESDESLDAALSAMGMDPWPLPSKPGAVLIWLQDGASWRLGAVLLDSDEAMMRPPLPAELLAPRLDDEDVESPPPPPPIPPPRMRVESLEIPGVVGGHFTPRRSNAAGTRVLLVADSPVDLSGAVSSPSVTLRVSDRRVELHPKLAFYSVNLEGERYITNVPHIVSQEEA